MRGALAGTFLVGHVVLRGALACLGARDRGDLVAAGRMSNSEALAPSVSSSRWALRSARRAVNPGIVYARASAGQAQPVHGVGGDDQRVVESKPLETPITMWSIAVACRRGSSPRTWML